MATLISGFNNSANSSGGNRVLGRRVSGVAGPRGRSRARRLSCVRRSRRRQTPSRHAASMTAAFSAHRQSSAAQTTLTRRMKRLGGIEGAVECKKPGLEQIERHRHVNWGGAKEARFFGQALSGNGVGLGDLAQNRKYALTRSAASGGCRRLWIRNVEQIRDLIVNRQEPLRLSS
jgi:hypothetical protein